MPQSSDALTTALDLLRDPARRAILYVLVEHGAVTTDQLADVIVGVKLPQGDEQGAGPGDHQRALTALRHAHLPRLVDADVVRVADNPESVALTREAGPLFELLSVTRRFEDVAPATEYEHLEDESPT